MYVPSFSAVDDEEQARAMVADIASAWLVTATGSGPPAATLMPILWREDRVIAHMAAANPHWRTIVDGTSGLMIVHGPEAYISPSWYASKAEHGRVVPTWNYLAVHLTGPIHTHRDPEWLRHAVTELTNHHEQTRDDPWHVTDAPADFITSQLPAIVGVDMHVETFEAKAKLSQNRPSPDQLGVINGLRREPHLRDNVSIAAEIDELRAPRRSARGSHQPQRLV